MRVLIKCCKSVNFKLRLCPKYHNPQVAVTKITRGLPVPRLLVKRVKGPKGEKRRSISGTVFDIHQCNQTKTGRGTAYL